MEEIFKIKKKKLIQLSGNQLCFTLNSNEHEDDIMGREKNHVRKNKQWVRKQETKTRMK